MWEVRGKYPGQPWETIDTADAEREARQLRREYAAAFGPEWKITIRRAPK